MGEPWCYRPWEIRQLTDYQISELLFCPRDKEGKPVIGGSGGVEDRYREVLFECWRSEGITEAELWERWEEQKRKREEAEARRIPEPQVDYAE